MSAPQTNIEKQQRRHRPALWGMWAGLIFAGLLVAVYVGWLFVQTDGPEGAETQIEVLPGAVRTDTAD